MIHNESKAESGNQKIRNRNMNTMIVIALLTLNAVCSACIVGSFRQRESVWNAYDHTPHENGHLGRVAEAAFGTRHLLAKAGGGAGSIDICAATDEPLGPCMDTPGVGERASVLFFGATRGTKTMIASKVLVENARVYTTAGGKVTNVSVTGCYLVGRTAEAAAGDGSPVEVVPCFPVVQA